MPACICSASLPVFVILHRLSWQGAAADSEAKSKELSQAVEELHKLLKDAGEGKRLLCNHVFYPRRTEDVQFVCSCSCRLLGF